MNTTILRRQCCLSSRLSLRLFQNFILLDSELKSKHLPCASPSFLLLHTSRLRFCSPFCPLTTCIIMPRFVLRFCTRKDVQLSLQQSYLEIILSTWFCHLRQKKATCLRTWNNYAFVSLASSDSNNLVEPSSTEQIMFWLRRRFLQSLPAVSNFCRRGRGGGSPFC